MARGSESSNVRPRQRFLLLRWFIRRVGGGVSVRQLRRDRDRRSSLPARLVAAASDGGGVPSSELRLPLVSVLLGSDGATKHYRRQQVVVDGEPKQ
nr:hypothetical protein Iba_scaffold259CG0290 [Ipomoea batatas]